MSDSVEQIKSKLSIVDVVAPYTELKQAGKNLKGKSPFTNEKTPSFFVSPDRDMYYCFSSNKGGDIFTFIQAMEGVDFKGALKILADKAGVELRREDPKKRTVREQKFTLLEATALWFEENLTDCPAAKAYLKERGVKPKTIKQWRIGYAPPEWRELKDYLTGLKFDPETMRAVGLIKGDEGKEPYDVFRDRIVFPICDMAGRVVAFSGRLLGEDENAPKYLNSPETELFNKSEILFGYHTAKQGIRKLDFSLLVEGQFDLVLAHQAGYTNTVAVSGTAFSDRHAELLRRLSARVVLAFDRDRAGTEAAKRATEVMLKRGADVKVATLEEGTDPADLIKKDPTAFKTAIKGANSVIEWLLDIILEAGGKDKRAYKLRVKEEVLPFVLMIPDKIDQDHFTELIAERIGTTKEAVKFELERRDKAQSESVRSVSKQAPETKAEPPVATERITHLKEHLIVWSDLLSGVEGMAFAGKTLRRILTEILGSEIKDQPDDNNRARLIFSLETKLESIPQRILLADLAGQVEELHTRISKERMVELKRQLRTAELAGDTKATQAIMPELTKAQQELGSVSYTAEIFIPAKEDATTNRVKADLNNDRKVPTATSGENTTKADKSGSARHL